MFWSICGDIFRHIFGVCDCVHEEAVTWEAHFNTSAINANFTAAFLSIENCFIFHEFYFIAEWRRISHESSIVSHCSCVFYSTSSTINFYYDLMMLSKPRKIPMPMLIETLNSKVSQFHLICCLSHFLDFFRGWLPSKPHHYNWLSMGEFEP